MNLSPKIKKSLRALLDNEVYAVKNLSSLLNKDMDKAIGILGEVKGRIIISGLGKSGHIGLKISATLTSLGIPAVFIHPTEALHGDLGLIGKGDGLIAISNSGETKELIKVVNHVKRHNIPVVSITAKSGSELGKLSDASLVFKIKSEGSPFGIAPMASTTATLVLGDMLATALALKNNFSKNDFADFHPAGSLGLQLNKVQDIMLKGKNIPLVSDSRPFGSALKEITLKKMGIVGVVDNKGFIRGAITDGDIRRFLTNKKYNENAIVRDVMSKNPKTINGSASLYEAISKMETNKITALFVVSEKGKPQGIIHMHQIVENQII